MVLQWRMLVLTASPLRGYYTEAIRRCCITMPKIVLGTSLLLAPAAIEFIRGVDQIPHCRSLLWLKRPARCSG
jgi:hypothetical protein